MKKLVFVFLIIVSNYAKAKYSCAVNLEIIDFNGRSTSLRLTNNPLFDDMSSSVISMEDGSVIDPNEAYQVSGVDFRKYDINMSFDLLQRVEDQDTYKFFLHQSSIIDPDPIFGKVYLLSTLERGSESNAIVVPNGTSIVLATSKSNANGELFYIVDCSK